jgi:hypothetical protein
MAKQAKRQLAGSGEALPAGAVNAIIALSGSSSASGDAILQTVNLPAGVYEVSAQLYGTDNNVRSLYDYTLSYKEASTAGFAATGTSFLYLSGGSGTFQQHRIYVSFSFIVRSTGSALIFNETTTHNTGTSLSFISYGGAAILRTFTGYIKRIA